MPVDHLVDRRPRMWRNRAAAKTLYIRLLILVVQAMQIHGWTGNANPQFHHIEKSHGVDFWMQRTEPIQACVSDYGRVPISHRD
jgi:hypothetical protein